MSLANCSAKMTALLQILKLEGKLLRSGRLSEIDAIIKSKAKAVHEVEAALSVIESEETLKQLRTYIMALDKLGQENGRLLQSVLAGARAARARIASLQNQAAQVGTYDLHGKKHSLANLAGRTNKTV